MPCVTHPFEQPQVPGPAGPSRPGNEGALPLASERTETPVCGGCLVDTLMPTHVPGQRSAPASKERSFLSRGKGVLVAGRASAEMHAVELGGTVHGPPQPEHRPGPRPVRTLGPDPTGCSGVKYSSLSRGGAGRRPLNLSLFPPSLLKLKDRSHPWLIFTHPS